MHWVVAPHMNQIFKGGELLIVHFALFLIPITQKPPQVMVGAEHFWKVYVHAQ